jgi:hypothetical protein
MAESSPIPLGQWSGSDATKQLEETIKSAQLESSKQQKTTLKVAIASAIFAFGALVLSLIQLCVSMKAR